MDDDHAPKRAALQQDAFDELAQISLADNSVESVVTTIAEVGKRLLPGVVEASVTFLQDRKPCTVAFTGDLAMRMAERQYASGQGPCLEAASSGQVLLVDDAPHGTRWPDYAAGARDHGVGSSLSVPVPLQPRISAALNLYSHNRAAFSDEDVQLAQALAGYAGVALANMHLYRSQAQVAEHLQIALDSRAVIDQAKGIVMGQRRCDADTAFKILVRLSQDSNRKLRDVAQALVDSASAPQPADQAGSDKTGSAVQSSF